MECGVYLMQGPAITVRIECILKPVVEESEWQNSQDIQSKKQTYDAPCQSKFTKKFHVYIFSNKKNTKRA